MTKICHRNITSTLQHFYDKIFFRHNVDVNNDIITTKVLHPCNDEITSKSKKVGENVLVVCVC